MIYDYKTHIAKNGANVYFVAEGNESGAIEKTTITPANPLCQCYSVSKAYTALAVGICCDRGLLTPDAHVTDVLRKDFPFGYDKNGITLRLTTSFAIAAGLRAECWI
ncbi:MAG: serine hydrolase [Christensenellales bacterium]